jgi:hypothetical protein
MTHIGWPEVPSQFFGEIDLEPEIWPATVVSVRHTV